jgi:hypothetical protein
VSRETLEDALGRVCVVVLEANAECRRAILVELEATELRLKMILRRAAEHQRATEAPG